MENNGNHGNRRIKDRRHLDITLASLSVSFLEHTAHRERIEAIQNEMIKSLACLQKSVDGLKKQMPYVHEVITQWTTIKGIFWLVVFSVLATIGAVSSWNWILDHAKRLFGD